MTSEIINQIVKCLAQGHIPLTVHEDGIDAVLLTQEGNFRFRISLNAEPMALILRAPFLMKVPPERRGVVAQAAMHMNQRMLAGGFYLDNADGELGFDLSVPCGGTDLSDEQILTCVGILGGAVVQLTPALRLLATTTGTLEDVFDLKPQAASVREELEELFAKNPIEGPRS